MFGVKTSNFRGLISLELLKCLSASLHHHVQNVEGQLKLSATLILKTQMKLLGDGSAKHVAIAGTQFKNVSEFLSHIASLGIQKLATSE